MTNTGNFLHRLTVGFVAAAITLVLITPAMAQSKPKLKSHPLTSQKRMVTPPKKLQQEQIQSQLDMPVKRGPLTIDKNVIRPKTGRLKYKGVIKGNSKIDKDMIIRPGVKKK